MLMYFYRKFYMNVKFPLWFYICKNGNLVLHIQATFLPPLSFLLLHNDNNIIMHFVMLSIENWRQGFALEDKCSTTQVCSDRLSLYTSTILQLTTLPSLPTSLGKYLRNILVQVMIVKKIIMKYFSLEN